MRYAQEVMNLITSFETEAQDYLAHLAHEMRSPLHSIQGFTYMLQEKCGDQDTEIQEWLSHIHSVSKHLLDLVNDIVDVNRLSDQTVEVANEAIKIDQILTDCSESLAPQIKEAHISLKINIASDMHLYWRGDKRKIRQILINLLSNAIKFTPANGKINIGLTTSNDMIVLTVQDTGIGMDQKTISNLFTPYFHSKSRINQQGTGLGLVITKRLVELMQGDIQVVSKPHQGTTFTVRLKLITDHEASTKPPSLSQNAHALPLDKSIKLLLIDDDPLHHQVMAGMLKKYPIEVFHAYSAQEALLNCPEIRPNLILIDYYLQDSTGLQLAQTLRNCSRRIENPYPITLGILTAHRGKELQQAMSEKVIDAILYKPLDMDDLLTLVTECQQKLDATTYTIAHTSTQSLEDYLIPLWPAFNESMDTGLIACDQALQNNNYQEIKDIAHKLKGQAMVFHHHKYSQLLQSLEDFATEKQTSLIVALLKQLRQTYIQERNLS